MIRSAWTIAGLLLISSPAVADVELRAGAALLVGLHRQAAVGAQAAVTFEHEKSGYSVRLRGLLHPEPFAGPRFGGQADLSFGIRHRLNQMLFARILAGAFFASSCAGDVCGSLGPLASLELGMRRELTQGISWVLGADLTLQLPIVFFSGPVFIPNAFAAISF